MDWSQVLAVILTAIGGFVLWFLNETSKRRFEDYVRREQHYAELVKALRGFHISAPDLEARERFLTEVDLSWLYGSDGVVRSAYAFTEASKTGSTTEQRLAAAGNLVYAMRQDLLRRKPLKRSELKPDEFQILDVNKSI